jgi:hypothetical protein
VPSDPKNYAEQSCYAARARFRRRAQARLPAEVRQQFLDAIYSGQPFRRVLRDLGLTSNQVWGLTRTDQEWSERLESALTATPRDDLQHGTNAAYVQDASAVSAERISGSGCRGTAVEKLSWSMRRMSDRCRCSSGGRSSG